jgi:peptidoglycan biosynthesis protein MviN/MurJ (putative lipid II flippase)
MSPAGKRSIVLLGLVALSCAVGWGLMALETRLAPLPQGFDEAGLDQLIASMWRWQLIYLPLLGLATVGGAALALDGGRAWIDAAVAMLFVLAMVLMVQSTTASWLNAIVVATAYLVVGGALAQWLRNAKNRKRD